MERLNERRNQIYYMKISQEWINFYIVTMIHQTHTFGFFNQNHYYYIFTQTKAFILARLNGEHACLMANNGWNMNEILKLASQIFAVSSHSEVNTIILNMNWWNASNLNMK